MLQTAGGLSLPNEALEHHGILMFTKAMNLDRHFSGQSRIVHPVDGSHAPFADQFRVSEALLKDLFHNSGFSLRKIGYLVTVQNRSRLRSSL